MKTKQSGFIVAKVKSYKDVRSFTQNALNLDSYDSWLITEKNKIIVAIVKARKSQGISQKELADLLATTQSVISRLEGGTCKSITLDYLMKVACALGLASNVTVKRVA